MNGIRVFIVIFMLSICRAETVARLQGMVESESSLVGNQFVVELENVDHGGSRRQAYVASDGSFEFQSVPSGFYTVRLANAYGSVLAEQLTDISTTPTLTIRAPKVGSSAGVGAAVSVQRLQKPVPEKAFRAFLAAQQDSQRGRPAEAIAKLERALEVFPDYSEARCNLAVQFLRLGRRDEAIVQLEKAIAAGPPAAIVYANLSYALFTAARFEQSEQAARSALALDSTFPLAHYLLGCLLARTRLDTETLRHLRLGAEASPRAHLEIARVLQSKGDRDGAAEELRQYLKSGDPAFEADAKRWLNTLR